LLPLPDLRDPANPGPVHSRHPSEIQIGGSLIRRLVASVVGFGLFAVAVAVFAASVGPAEISLRETAAALFGWVPVVGPRLGRASTDALAILLEYRFPRVVLAGVVGMSLSTSGAALQGLLGNPLADPYIIGVSAGAAVGAALAVLVGIQSAFGGMAVPLSAFAGALAAISLVIAVARTGGRLPTRGFLLAGVVVGSFFWSAVTLLLALSGQSMQEIVYWLLGSLSGADKARVWMAGPLSALAAFGIWLFSKDLNLISLGEEPAHHLGVKVESVKHLIIALAALATASAVAVSGVIGFVGLIVPHMARSLVGPDHRVLIPSAALLGASFLILADTAARTLFGAAELPVGVLTALMGGPFFCYLLRTRGLR
jgi:iron complex transport system permease protein